MRRAGLMNRAERFGSNDHACWAYSTAAERTATITAWLSDGIALGQRAMYVADASVEVLTEELAGVPDRDEAIARGALTVVPIRALYDMSEPIDPDAQLTVYAAAVQEALDEGYAGIRLAADITALVTDPARRSSHLHWEQFADRYTAQQPLAPLCIYDRTVVEDFVAVEHIHPLSGPEPPSFSLYAIAARIAALHGEMDACSAGVLSEALQTLPDADDAIALTDVRFVDGRAAWVLQQALDRRRALGRPLKVLDAPASVRLVWSVCGFDPDLLAAH